MQQIAMLLISMAAPASDYLNIAPPTQQREIKVGPTPAFGGFCVSVDAKVLENRPFHDTILYRWQTDLYQFAGVTATDTVATINLKVGRYMNANIGQLTCNMINFNPRNGNIYKLAVARQNDDFLSDATHHWTAVNFNHVDKTDGKTVLDYVEQRRQLAGPLFTRALDRYYGWLRKAGAKHAREL
ncbi:MAG: hypothetical protein EOP94_01555 [Zymomonas sp.]|nr:MAG: hypothetical protein EOP94_01555 [Zymomonas sp.]